MILTGPEILLLKTLDFLRELPGAPDPTAEITAYFAERNITYSYQEWETATRKWRSELRDDNPKSDTV